MRNRIFPQLAEYATARYATARRLVPQQTRRYTETHITLTAPSCVAGLGRTQRGL